MADTQQYAFESMNNASVVSWLWDFGDGREANSANVTLPFTTNGTYLVSLTVANAIGQVDTALVMLAVGQSPPLATPDSFEASSSTDLLIETAQLLANDATGVLFNGFGQPLNGGQLYELVTASILRYAPPQLSEQETQRVDSFYYKVTDAAREHEHSAQVTIIVTRTPPVANPDYFSTLLNTPWVGGTNQLRANDSPGAFFVGVQNPVNGTVLVGGGIDPNGDRPITFTPALNFAGTASFEYLISWNNSEPYETGVAYIAVADSGPISDFVIIGCSNQSDCYCPNYRCTVHEGATDDIGVAEYLWEWGDGQSTRTSSNADLSHTYSHAGRYTIKLFVTDTNGHVSQNRANGYRSEILVLVNTPPVAVNDTVTTRRDAAVTIAVLANDSDFDGDYFEPVVIAKSHEGAVVQSANLGTAQAPIPALRVTPPSLFAGTLTLTYMAIDRWGGQSNQAVVTITVDAPPVAAFTASCTMRTCSFNASSSTDDFGIASYSWNFGDGSAAGTGVTTSRAYAAGNTYTVVLTVTDTLGQTATKSQAVFVNRPPVAVADSRTTTVGAALDINVLANDSDADGQTLVVTSWSQAAHGAVSKNANGTLRYAPVAGYSGSDSFTYTLSDGLETATATVTLSVTVPNTAPDARSEALAVSQWVASTISFATLLGNDFDPDGNAISIASFDTAGIVGSVSCSMASQSCTYTPPGYVVTTSFRYTLSDGVGTDIATVKLYVGTPSQNQAPVAVDDYLVATMNQPLAFQQFALLANDTDPNGDQLSVTSLTPMAVSVRWGTVSCSTPIYNCTYTPPAGFTGVDTFTYSAGEALGGGAAGRVHFVVGAPNPRVLDAREDQYVASGGYAFVPRYGMLSNDYEPQGQVWTIVSYDTAGLSGTLDCTATGCEFRYGAPYSGLPTRFRYTVRNPQGATATATVTLKTADFNFAPVAQADQFTTRVNTPLTFTVFDLMRNDYDPDNDQLQIGLYSSPRLSCAPALSPAYVCTYTPAANFTGTDTLYYTAGDGLAVTGQIPVTVTVTP